MKLRYEFQKSKENSQNLNNKEFDVQFEQFLQNDFARKNQKLDRLNFELEFYQSLFHDVLSSNQHAQVTDFVCPTSSRPSVESQCKLEKKNPSYVSTKLASKYRTINSAYLHTIYESRNFQTQMKLTIEKYLKKFACYQIKSKFEIIISNWQNYFLRRSPNKTIRNVVNTICDEVTKSKVKLAWPLEKIETAKLILEKDLFAIWTKPS